MLKYNSFRPHFLKESDFEMDEFFGKQKTSNDCHCIIKWQNQLEFFFGWITLTSAFFPLVTFKTWFSSVRPCADFCSNKKVLMRALHKYFSFSSRLPLFSAWKQRPTIRRFGFWFWINSFRHSPIPAKNIPRMMMKVKLLETNDFMLPSWAPPQEWASDQPCKLYLLY